MILGFVNRSTLVSDADVEKIARAIDFQFSRDVLPAWRRQATPGGDVLFLGHDAPSGPGALAIPPGTLPIVFLDAPDATGALGIHNEGPDGGIVGKVFCGAIMASGGGVLTASASGDSISAVASHEAIEAKFDPNVNLWVDGPITVAGKAWASTAFELCDAVQSYGYEVSGSGFRAQVSNFVLPAWLDLRNSKGPWDHLGVLKGPLSMSNGGYLLVRDAPGTEDSIFAMNAPNARPWRIGNRRRVRLEGAPKGERKLP